MNEMILLNQKEAEKAEQLLNDWSLDYLSAWEPGVYRALTVEGDDLGFVMCSSRVAQVVNGCIARKA